MENWLFEIMNEYVYLGIIFLIAGENIFPPIPSVILIFIQEWFMSYCLFW